MCHSCGRSQVVPQGERHTYREMSCVGCGRLLPTWRHCLYCRDCHGGLKGSHEFTVARQDIAGQEERIARYTARAAAGLSLFEEVHP